MKRSDKRILTTHVGSIIRLVDLLEAARAARAHGGADAANNDSLLVKPKSQKS